jgi:hypothetical protein
MTEFLQTPMGRLSWARLSSLICLACAIALAWCGRSESLVSSFLWASIGSYGSSKITELFKCKNGGA